MIEFPFLEVLAAPRLVLKKLLCCIVSQGSVRIEQQLGLTRVAFLQLSRFSELKELEKLPDAFKPSSLSKFVLLDRVNRSGGIF